MPSAWPRGSVAVLRLHEASEVGEAKPMNRWWLNRPDELFWFETTDRSDIGEDLNAPQLNEEGRPYWSYDLVREVRPGDVVAHYHEPTRTIQSWSRAVGLAFESEVLWGAHGMASGRGPVHPYPRAAGAYRSTDRTQSPSPSLGQG